MTYEPDPDREIFVATVGGETSHPLDMLRTLAPGVAIFEERGRAAGWREAIEALRAHVEANYHPVSIDGARLRKIAAELESLAPKETP